MLAISLNRKERTERVFADLSSTTPMTLRWRVPSIPPGKTGHVLLTTRAHPWAQSLVASRFKRWGPVPLDVLLCETVRDKIAARLFVDPSGVSVLRPFIYLRTAPFGPNHACNCRIKVAMSK